jgi:hypothetical protein
VLHHNPSRHERAVTFGPAGRIGVSAVLFVPVAFGAYFSVFFLAAAAVWMLVLPMALHQIWQPARVENNNVWPSEPRVREAARTADTVRR